MKPYSEDLRTRIIDAVDRHDGSLREIAGRFRVSPSFIVRLSAPPSPDRVTSTEAPWRRQASGSRRPPTRAAP